LLSLVFLIDNPIFSRNKSYNIMVLFRLTLIDQQCHAVTTK
jgi:hypothetical protein